MSTVENTVNVNAVKTQTNTRPRNLEQVAVAAALKTLDKEFDRDAIDGGESAHVSLSIVGVIDGDVVLDRKYEAALSVGHDSVRSSSATPNQAHLVAAILAKLNHQTRDKILRELPEEFAAAGNELPAVEDSAVKAADAMLKRLRAKKEQKVRGSVSCQYTRVNG